MNATVTGLKSRAAVLGRFGAALDIAEFSVPAPPPGGAIIAIDYGGICGTDLHLQHGHLPIPTPLVLGHEGLGRIAALDEAMTTDTKGNPLAVGDAVMWASSISCGTCRECAIEKEPTLCSKRQTYGVNRSTETDAPLSGAWAEHICIQPGTTVIKVPDGTDPVAAMALACAGPTLVHALERRPVKLGETVIVQGSGPVGLAAAAMARLSGAARVIIVGGPKHRLDLAARCGIGDIHIDITAGAPDAAMAEAISHTPNGAGADFVIECTGVPAAVAQGLRLARRGGAYLVVGQYTDSGDTTINPHQIVYRQLDVIGSWAFSGAHLVRYVELLPQLCSTFDLGPLVTQFDLGEVNNAMKQVAEGTVVKAVLKCSGS